MTQYFQQLAFLLSGLPIIARGLISPISDLKTVRRRLNLTRIAS